MVDFVTNLARRRNIPRALQASAASHCLVVGVLVVLAGQSVNLVTAEPPWRLWPSAVMIGAVTAFIFGYLPDHQPVRVFGWANRITLARAAVIALFAGLIGHDGLTDTVVWATTGVAALALAFDGMDGWAARQQRVSSRFGARFDMEIDALFIVILALMLVDIGKIGVWVMLSGALRYLFMAGGWIWPWLQRPLPASFRRRAICALQVAVLVACLAPVIEPAVAGGLAAAALALLTGSFAADIVWLLYHRPITEGDRT